MSFAQDLRASVLQAAMQGKLTEQLETDTPVSELLTDIRAEKERLIAEKKIKKEKPLSAISEDDIPFDIPESWEWIKMGELVKISTGKRDANYGTEDGKYDFYTCSKEPIKSPTFSFEGECLILPGNGANVGEVYYYNGQFEAYQRTYVLEKYSSNFNVRFLEKVLLWNWRQFNANKQFGSAIPYIKLGNLQDFPIPLPPIEEQKRIVRRIEEIMIHIDELEAIEEELKKLKEVFPGDMKNAILQAAMQGKLTEQLDTDSSVDDLLEDIKKEREKLVKEGKIKKSRTKQNNNFVAFNDGEEPFEIPDNWRWVNLANVSIIQEGAGIRKFQYRDNGVQLLCVTNITNEGVCSKLKEIYIGNDEYLEKYKHLTLNKGDIVTACSGGSWGKVCEYTLDDKMMLNTSTLRMRFFSDIANNKYLLYVCRSEFFKKQLRDQLSGIQPNFGYAHYSQITFPLPPLEEQNRIVAKLEQILPLISDLS